jgi:hypothetical protein
MIGRQLAFLGSPPKWMVMLPSLAFAPVALLIE